MGKCCQGKRLTALLVGFILPVLFGCKGEDDWCTVEVEVQLVFYNNVCYFGWIECDGEVKVEHDLFLCDMEYLTCTEPDRSNKFVLRYLYDGRSCRFCSDTDDGVRCTPISGECGKETIEHIASGSPETGLHPLAEVCDAGQDAGGGKDAGEDAGGSVDAGVDVGGGGDAGVDAGGGMDAGADPGGGQDAGMDAG